MTGTRPLSEHVRAHLIATGVLTTEGLGRRAGLRQCARCAAPVLVGLDASRCALLVVLDLAALDRWGEAMALLAGRPTFELWGREIEYRNHFKIAGGQPRLVIAEHDCRVRAEPSAEVLALFVSAPPRVSPRTVVF